MEFYPSKQEVVIIKYASIIWTVWDLYRAWDKTTQRLPRIYNYFTAEDGEENEQAAADAAPPQ